jgi:hypothetical protein
MAHEELRTTWAPGQRWETRIVSTKDGPVPDPVWTPVADGKEPMWDPYQEYRQVPVAPTVEAFDRQDVEAVTACLGDDAAQLRQDNEEDERAANMDRAASMLTWMLLTHPTFNGEPR